MKVTFKTTEEVKSFVRDFKGEEYSVALEGKNSVSFEVFKKEAEWFDTPYTVEISHR